MLRIDSLTFGPAATNRIGSHFSLNVEAGEIAAVIGPSGSGKTTLLRAIAGLAHISEGTISFGGEDMTDAPLGKRRIAYMEQSFPLFDELTAAENVQLHRLGLRGRLDDRALSDAVDALTVLGLEEAHALRRPTALSGGERQRVALARAIAAGQPLMLLDEPFSNLGGTAKSSAVMALMRHVKASGATAVVVCHDAFDAVQMANLLVPSPYDASSRIVEIGSDTDLSGLARATGFGVPAGVQSLPRSAFRGQSGSSDVRDVSFISSDVSIARAAGDATDQGMLAAEAQIMSQVSTPLGVLTNLSLTGSDHLVVAFKPHSAPVTQFAAGETVLMMLGNFRESGQ